MIDTREIPIYLINVFRYHCAVTVAYSCYDKCVALSIKIPIFWANNVLLIRWIDTIIIAYYWPNSRSVNIYANLYPLSAILGFNK